MNRLAALGYKLNSVVLGRRCDFVQAMRCDFSGTIQCCEGDIVLHQWTLPLDGAVRTGDGASSSTPCCEGAGGETGRL